MCFRGTEMNDTLKKIMTKHAEPQADLLNQRTPASQLACVHGVALGRTCEDCENAQTELYKSALTRRDVCPQCGAHGIADRCPFSSDDVIIANLAAMIVEEFSTRDAGMLIRLLCTEGPRIGLELHEALNAPEEE